MMKLVSMPAAVLLDVNGTLTDLRPIGAPWERSELGAAVLDGPVRTAMVDSLLGTAERPFSDHLRASLEVSLADAGLDFDGVEAAMAAVAEQPRLAGRRDGTRPVGRCRVADRGADQLRSGGWDQHVAEVWLALGELRCDAREVTLIATHPWDLAGAAHAGITTAWVTHGARVWPTVFPSPDIQGDSLLQVAEAIVS
jgi:2-haloacid dehalogenase